MKKLTKNKDDKVLFGICGGIGKYFDIDPVIIRIIFIVLFFTAGTGFIAYIIAIFIIPDEDKSFFDKRYSESNKKEENSSTLNEPKDDSKILLNNQLEDSSDNQNKPSKNTSELTGTIIGISLIVFGSLFLMRNFSFFNDIYYSIIPLVRKFFWPGILIGLGALVIYKNKDNG